MPAIAPNKQLERVLKAIVQRHEAFGWSRQRFADKLGWTRPTLSRVLTMTVAVRFTQVVEMANLLGTTVAELANTPEEDLAGVELRVPPGFTALRRSAAASL